MENNNCNLTTCRYNQSGTCTNEDKTEECGCLFDLEGLFAGITCREPRYCENCKYWADNEICVNGYSEQVANFTDRDFSCKFYEREGKNGQKN